MDKAKTYTLGLDIGIASIGWAVVENTFDPTTKEMVPYRLLRTGVRIFDAAENPKDGGSLAADRREARSVRKRLRRRSQRLKQLKKILQENGFIKKYSELDSALNFDPYKLRSAALDKKITNLELSKVILHIAKRRGFKSARKDMNLEKEGGTYKKFIDENRKRLEENGYRTVGELLAKSMDFATTKRNRHGEYRALVTRDMLDYEIETILAKQKEFGNSLITSGFIESLKEILFFQRPFASGDAIKKLVGKCTFEPEEIRASKYSVSFEIFSLLQKITNTMLYSKDSKETFHIDDEKKQEILELAKSKQKISYKDLRKLLQLSNDVIFEKFRYKRPNSEKDWEAEPFFEMKGYHTLKSAFKKTPYWKDLEANIPSMNAILQALTLYKTDEDIEAQLKKDGIAEDIITVVLTMKQFSKFGHLSLKALDKLIPLLYTKRYDEAWREVYPNAHISGDKRLMVPKIPTDEIRNPVVLRSITQTRKVINAIIGEYGSPSFIHIELGREMSKNFKERKALEKRMNENFLQKLKLKSELKEIGVVEPSGDLLFRYGLWKSQKNECAYSTQKISFQDLLNPNRTQVDHILPYSRSLDDSYDNKVLVFVEENQRKKNRTPIEYLTQEYGKDSERMRLFLAWVNGLETSYQGISPRKKEYLLNTDLAEVKLEDYIERDLNDMRYISRFVKNFLEERLVLKELPAEVQHKKRRVFTFPGFFTARMRHNFGIPKDRSETNRHHGMDAIILAVSNYSMMKAVADFYRKKETLNKVDDKDAPKFVEPWNLFKTDVMTRVYGDDMTIYETDPNLKVRYAESNAWLLPLFVSKMINHKSTGAAHEETFYSPKQANEGVVSVRKFDDETKSYIRKETKPSGFLVNNNKTFVQHANMVRLDVYMREGVYYLVPVYIADLHRKDRVLKAVKPGKPEKEWYVIDDSYKFGFSIYPNDYVEIIDSKGKKREGYYVKFNKSNGVLALLKHDETDKNKADFPVGCSAKMINKKNIDVLGASFS